MRRGLSTATLEAIDREAQTIQVGSEVYQLGHPGLLLGLEVGQRVTVQWDEAGDRRQARTVTIERPA
jgi:hypothetical protein